jgi:hypothetical protein
MVTGGRIPAIRDITKDEYGLKSMEDINPVDLGMSSKMWRSEDLCQLVK